MGVQVKPSESWIRWLVLGIFCVATFSNNILWMTFSPVESIFSSYYNVPDSSIDWMATVYLLAYVPFFLFASSIFSKWGLRVGVLVGCVLDAGGCWLRYVGRNPGSWQFICVLLGQIMAAIGQTFFLATPSRLATLWFGAHQRSTACSFAVLANQLGMAIGFVFGPAMVRTGHADTDIPFYLMVEAIFCTAVFVLALFFFSDPQIPESEAQDAHGVVVGQEQLSSFQSVQQALGCRSYLYMCLSFGLVVGDSWAVMALLSQLCQPQFPDTDLQTFGWMGFALVIMGLLGDVVCGVLLDKYKKFRLLNQFFCFTSAISLVAFNVALQYRSLAGCFVCSAMFGLTSAALTVSGYEFVALLLSVDETISSGLLNSSAMIVGIALISSAGNVQGFDKMTISWALCVPQVLGCIAVMFITEPKKVSPHHSEVNPHHTNPLLGNAAGK